MPELPVGRITFTIKGRDIAVPHDLKIPIPDDLNSDIWTDFGKDLYRKEGAKLERARFRAKVEELWQVAASAVPAWDSGNPARGQCMAEAEAFQIILRWLDEEMGQ